MAQKSLKNSQMTRLQNFEEPLDYTFMCLTTIGDCLEEESRNHNFKKIKPSAGSKGHEIIKKRTNAIRLSNNVLIDWKDFLNTVSKLVESLHHIEWIDLSFNDISNIDKCVLEFRNLKILYLHGNNIEKISEVDKLSSLEHLRSLTLHGNPIEDCNPSYRHYVLFRLPNLKCLDFSGVTESDLANSRVYCRSKKKGKET
ncbi:leucine-rich repeat-containing protein 51 isoform X2 [Hydra vulgaris]|uniref:Leucine-rich repeat-containing protein 51 n=1 Tax=Hydra vulgaris TaxID=6087 RepID=A0ABM4D8L3_HYDVU